VDSGAATISPSHPPILPAGTDPTPPVGVRSSSQMQAAAAQAVTTPSPAPGGDPYIGTNVAGRYKILRKLGEGGMGVVYLAEHVFIEKKVAIKILSEDFARKADLVARFMQEAKAASKIGHENIIDITDFGETQNGGVFFAMEFLDGADLAGHIKQDGPMTVERVRYIFNQLCRALGAAHSKGIIHRDLKPENIYLIEREGRGDFVKVLDFGIAKISSLDEGGSRLTRTGMIFGTPEYMSPEQARGDKPDHRVDIYAVGCILYEMLTGDVPFHAETFMGVLTKHMFEQPEPPSQRAPEQNISPDIEAVVLKALAKDRDQRYQTMKEMAMALESAVGGDPNRAWGSEGSSVMAVTGSSTSNRISTGTANRMNAQRRTPLPAQDEAPKKSSKGLVFAALGVVLVASGVGAVVMMNQKPPPPPAPVVAAPPPRPVEPPKPVEAPRPAAPVLSKVQIESTPSEAEIFNGPEKLGVTPASLEFKPDTAAFEVVLKKKGYKDQKLRVSPDKSRDYVVELSAERKPSSGSRPSSPKPATREPEARQPETKTEAKPAGKLRDLKDPFAN
jgi:serine/threonine-protein kinase